MMGPLTLLSSINRLSCWHYSCQLATPQAQAKAVYPGAVKVIIRPPSGKNSIRHPDQIIAQLPSCPAEECRKKWKKNGEIEIAELTVSMQTVAPEKYAAVWKSTSVDVGG